MICDRSPVLIAPRFSRVRQQQSRSQIGDVGFPGPQPRISELLLGDARQMQKDWIQQNVDVAVAFNHTSEYETEDGFPRRAGSGSPLLPLIAVQRQAWIANPIGSGDRQRVGRLPQGLDVAIFERVIYVQQLLESPNRRERYGRDLHFQSFPRLLAVKCGDLGRGNQPSRPLRFGGRLRHTGRGRERVMLGPSKMMSEEIHVQLIHTDPAHSTRRPRRNFNRRLWDATAIRGYPLIARHFGQGESVVFGGR